MGQLPRVQSGGEDRSSAIPCTSSSACAATPLVLPHAQATSTTITGRRIMTAVRRPPGESYAESLRCRNASRDRRILGNNSATQKRAFGSSTAVKSFTDAAVSNQTQVFAFEHRCLIWNSLFQTIHEIDRNLLLDLPYLTQTIRSISTQKEIAMQDMEADR